MFDPNQKTQAAIDGTCAYPNCDCTIAPHCTHYILPAEPEPVKYNGWIGVDLDACLAEYSHWEGVEHIGPPVDKMLQRVKTMLKQGKDVRIFTARVWRPREVRPTGTMTPEALREMLRNYPPGNTQYRQETRRWMEAELSIYVINKWCKQHIGLELPITNVKDPYMVSLFDDRAVQVEPNTGDTLEDKIWRLQNPPAIQPANPRQG